MIEARDAADERGQMGFLRLAATVENYRKTQGSGSGQYEMFAKADVLTAMLPTFKAFEDAENVSACDGGRRGGDSAVFS